MDFTKFTVKAKTAIQKAREIAQVKGHKSIETSHILKGIMLVDDNVAPYILKKMNVDVDLLMKIVDNIIKYYPRDLISREHLSPYTNQALDRAITYSLEYGDEFVSIEHILMGILGGTDVLAKEFVKEGITIEGIKSGLEDLRKGAKITSPEADIAINATNKYTRNLNELVKAGKLDPVIGRDDEIKRILQILSRRTKNNPLIIGESGVGKTAVALGIAHKIVSGDVPDSLKTKQIYSLDLTNIVSGAKYKGEFEERLKGVFNEIIASNGEIILFIDEIHNLIGTNGGEGSMDGADILKPILSRGEMLVIGATTTKEYHKYFEQDKSFERRFQTVTIEEPTVDEAIAILMGLKGKYETFHNVTIKDEAVVAAVELSKRYISNRFLPDKAIDILDEASSKLKLDAEAKEKVVDADQIAIVVSDVSQIPVNKLKGSEKERLVNLEKELHKRVIGQNEAIKAVSDAIRRSRTGLQDPKKPIGSFIFLGTTGVGKTELAKALAEFLFNDENSMVRIDMSEYQDKSSASKLIGSAPGYVGYDEGGQLTEAVKRKPYSVVLLDEIEKSHPDVFNTLLQVLDDGRLTDNKGYLVDFKNTIIVMTSNLGSNIIQSNMQGMTDETRNDVIKKTKEEVIAMLRRTIRPELLNRIDETIVFQPLTKSEILDIVKMQFNGIMKMLKKNGIDMTASEESLKQIAEWGYDPQFGARPVKRVIQEKVINVLSGLMLEDKVMKDNAIFVDVKDGQLLFINK